MDATAKHSLIEAARRLESWVTQQALPLWLSVGRDPQSGGHYEHLNADGSPDQSANVRVRVQARQAFVYAMASSRRWCNGEREARELMRFAEQQAAHPNHDAGFTHLLNADFQVIDTRQDLYDHAFFVLAYTWCYRAFGDAGYLAKAEALVDYLDTAFAANYGGWSEGDYPYEHRRQNPHMHLFEVFLNLYDATQNGKWLARAGEIFTLFENRFFCPDKQVLLEFFQEDWRVSPGAIGQEVEPGHMLEWVWLLDWYNRRTGRPVEQYSRALYTKALAIGQSPSGLVYDAVDADGTVRKPSKRSWGLTELIKASLVRVRQGDTSAYAHAVQGIDNLFTYYLCASTPGAHVDQRGANDEVTVDTAPASTLYHLIVLAAEVQDHVKGRV